MRLYIIEKLVEFDPEEQHLTHTTSSERIALSVVTARLLENLIEKQSHVVNRETLFSDVLDRYGAASTNNNLNQYILNLRKQLLYMGIENEVIQTVPRIGFMVPAATEIEQKEKNKAPVVTPERVDRKHPPLSRRTLLGSMPKAWLILMALIIALTSFRYWHGSVNSMTWDDIPYATLIPVNMNRMCQIFLIPSGIGFKSGEHQDFSALGKNFPEISCEEAINTHFYVHMSAHDHGKYRHFVVKCTGDSTTPPVCFSHYASTEQ